MLAKAPGSEQPDTFGVNANLNDLPTELLLMIFELLDDKELFHLTLLCKRFHYLVLPIYMSRQPGYYSSGYVLISGFPFRMLRALRVALFVDSISSIEMLFTCGNSVIRAMKELERLIHQMKYVWTFSIDFTYLWGNWELGGLSLSKAVVELLEVVVGKACNKLTIQRLDVGNSALLAGKSKKKSKRTRDIALSRLPRDISPLTTLRQLTIANSRLLCPTLRAWVINSINLSPITKLELNNVSFSQNPSSTSATLRLLTLPLLTHFSISSPHLIYRHLKAFLGRHHRIQILSLSTDAAIQSKSPFPVNAIPHLITLEATPHYICHFLASKHSFSNLTRIIFNPYFPLTISDDSVVAGCFEFAEESFMHLASRQNVTTLRFVLPTGPWANEWLLRGSRPENGKRRDLERTLVNITHLEVDVAGCCGFSPVIEPLFLRWLALFPALQYASFDFFAFMYMSAEEQSAFAKSIGDACCSMKVVEIGYKKYIVR